MMCCAKLLCKEWNPEFARHPTIIPHEGSHLKDLISWEICTNPLFPHLNQIMCCAKLLCNTCIKQLSTVERSNLGVNPCPFCRSPALVIENTFISRALTNCLVYLQCKYFSGTYSLPEMGSHMLRCPQQSFQGLHGCPQELTQGEMESHMHQVYKACKITITAPNTHHEVTHPNFW